MMMENPIMSTTIHAVSTFCTRIGEREPKQQQQQQKQKRGNKYKSTSLLVQLNGNTSEVFTLRAVGTNTASS